MYLELSHMCKNFVRHLFRSIKMKTKYFFALLCIHSDILCYFIEKSIGLIMKFVDFSNILFKIWNALHIITQIHPYNTALQPLYVRFYTLMS